MERYIAKPAHLLWAALFLLAGAVSFPFAGSWAWAGASLLLMGTSTWVWVIFSGLWHSYESYWREIAEVAKALSQTDSPEVWSALGFVAPAKNFKVEVSELDKKGYGATASFDLPGSAVQFTTFADGILMGRSLSETEWAGPGKLYSVPIFRRLKKELEERRLIVLKNVAAPTQGFTYTRKGKEVLLTYATEGVKLLLLEQRNLVAPKPTPSLSPRATLPN